MFSNKTIQRLEQMIDLANDGLYKESLFDESKLSRLESKWKKFIDHSTLSKKNLEEEKSELQALISDISHQTKTYMTNIKMYSELLLENITGSQDLLYAREIVNQSEKLEFLIISLSKISRLESDLFNLHIKSESVSNLVEEAISDLEHKALKKNVSLIFDKSLDLKANFDFKWTKEALINLLDNAIKYSNLGSKVIIFINEYEFYNAISVKDFGIGIKEEDLNRIFQRFYKGENAYFEEGVGLGLYLVKKIISKEDGYIKVVSKKDKGSEFTMFLKK